ncbi:SDR family oxidoreductase [Sphingomonas canadensis]|uniref:SDR family oxidoreductase n=1 Tax=Sphingomonas canadensis TaxID=1219257 RepID=A0ABW3H5R2_9SPHN|nr:SDR family oxidoreductase [Sphingomonas canadensis]MCW3835907.1 SDR family oxidoreductase [Sphingomonas canadensis]
MTSPLFLVTGGSRGIGAAIARSAAVAGYRVLLSYAGRADAAEAVADAIRAEGGVAEAVRADTGRPEDVAALFAAADRMGGPLAAAVYNGGITGGVGMLADQDDATLARVIEVNLTGALIFAREAIRRMSTRLGGQGGSIVLLSSRASQIGSPAQHVWYAASKGGIDSLTIGLAKEVAAEGIRVNGVAPGPIVTEIHAEGHLDRIVDALPMKRIGEPQEVADAVMYLVSDRASYVAGTTILVAGAR